MEIFWEKILPAVLLIVSKVRARDFVLRSFVF